MLLSSCCIAMDHEQCVNDYDVRNTSIHSIDDDQSDGSGWSLKIPDGMEIINAIISWADLPCESIENYEKGSEKRSDAWERLRPSNIIHPDIYLRSILITNDYRNPAAFSDFIARSAVKYCPFTEDDFENLERFLRWGLRYVSGLRCSLYERSRIAFDMYRDILFFSHYISGREWITDQHRVSLCHIAIKSCAGEAYIRICMAKNAIHISENIFHNRCALKLLRYAFFSSINIRREDLAGFYFSRISKVSSFLPIDERNAVLNECMRQRDNFFVFINDKHARYFRESDWRSIRKNVVASESNVSSQE